MTRRVWSDSVGMSSAGGEGSVWRELNAAAKWRTSQPFTPNARGSICMRRPFLLRPRRLHPPIQHRGVPTHVRRFLGFVLQQDHRQTSCNGKFWPSASLGAGTGWVRVRDNYSSPESINKTEKEERPREREKEKKY